MQFVDKCLSDDAIYAIEKMFDNHMSKNYQDVRDIIAGYDPKDNSWKSRYGEYMSKKYSFDIETPIMPKIYTLRSKKADKEDEKSCETFTKNNGMTFYEDDIYEYIRIYIDDSVKRVLEVLFTLSKNVMEYRDIVDIIITEWNANNVRDTILSNGPNMDFGPYGNLHYHKLEVRKSPWDDLKKIARHRGLTLRDAFKDSVITFLESRSDIIRRNDC